MATASVKFNERARAIQSRALYHICLRMGARITADMLVKVGEAPVATLVPNRFINLGGNLEFDDAGWDKERQYGFTEKPIAKVTSAEAAYGEGVSAELTFVSTERLGTNHLIRLDKARQAIIAHAARYAGRFESRFRQVNTYRSWRMMKESKKIVGRACGRALSEMLENVLPQKRNPRGVQRINARKWNGGPTKTGDERGLHCGKPAWKRHVGRPALSETAWLYAYKKRLEARRKTKHRRKSKGVTVPKTKWERPGPGMIKKDGKIGADGNQSPKKPAKRENHSDKVHDLLKEWSEKIGEKAGEAIADAVKEWFKG